MSPDADSTPTTSHPRGKTGVLRTALGIWWAATAVAGVAAATPLLTWFDVLRAQPFESVAQDVALLHEKLFAASTVVLTLPVRALAEGSVQQLVIWRVLLTLPSAMAMHASVSPGASIIQNATRILVAWPRFVGLTLGLQAAALSGAWLGIDYALGWFARPDVSPFALCMGTAALIVTLLFGLACLTLLDLARVALFCGSPRAGQTVWTCLLDGLEVLRRRSLSTIGLVAGYFALGATLSSACGAASAAAGAWAPEGLGQGVAWGLAQVGVLTGLGCRVLTWRRGELRLRAARPAELAIVKACAKQP
jgi:hypothetical protein